MDQVREKPWLAHYDPGVPPEIQVPDIPLWRSLKEPARRRPQTLSPEFLGKTLSYQELWGLARRFAQGLKDLGVRPGDRVAIMLPNSPQFVIAFYGTLLAGGVGVNVNPLYTPRELRHQLADAGAETLVILDHLLPRYLEVEKEVPVKRVVVTGIKDFLPFPKNLLYPLKATRDGLPPRTSPSSSTPAAPRASPRGRCSPTKTSWPTSSRLTPGTPPPRTSWARGSCSGPCPSSTFTG